MWQTDTIVILYYWYKLYLFFAECLVFDLINMVQRFFFSFGTWNCSFLFLFFFYDSMMQCNDFYNVVIED